MKLNTERFKTQCEIIRVELNEIYFELFIRGGPEIQQEWLRYIQELDRALKKALQSSVKASLHEL
jgi:hypothetical protein